MKIPTDSPQTLLRERNIAAAKLLRRMHKGLIRRVTELERIMDASEASKQDRADASEEYMKIMKLLDESTKGSAPYLMPKGWVPETTVADVDVMAEILHGKKATR